VKPVTSFKVLIYPEGGALGCEMLEKMGGYLFKIKCAQIRNM
jgi:hypothetical protein